MTREERKAVLVEWDKIAALIEIEEHPLILRDMATALRETLADDSAVVLAFAKHLESHMDYMSVNSQRKPDWPTTMAILFIANQLDDTKYEEELAIRKLLWLAHDCTPHRKSPKGSGEMECAGGIGEGDHEPIDFKRDSANDIERALRRHV